MGVTGKAPTMYMTLWTLPQGHGQKGYFLVEQHYQISTFEQLICLFTASNVVASLSHCSMRFKTMIMTH